MKVKGRAESQTSVPSQIGSANAPRSADAEAILAWYDLNARALPWRIGPAAHASGTRPDPYHVWLSEIMLQQTTVEVVKAYFNAFTLRWPSVEGLAAAPTDDIMSAWAGLGYYARARNLHACAKAVVERHGSRFPRSASELKTLPGIGDYTSAAIAAIAFDEPAAVVDGNVERVVTRLFAIEMPLPAARPSIRAQVETMVPRDRPGDFAQGMMDLGATICTPRRPACVLCPLRARCAAHAAGTMERYPAKAKKRAKPLRRGAAFVAVRRRDGAVWLRRRAETGLLGGMAEPPSSSWNSRSDGEIGADAAPFPADWRRIGAASHSFTHFDLELEVWRSDIAETPEGPGWWSPPDVLGREALPTLMKKALEIAKPGALTDTTSDRGGTA